MSRYTSPVLRPDLCEAAKVSPDQKVTYFSADLTKAEEAQKAITSCERVPDVVVCNAGTSAESQN